MEIFGADATRDLLPYAALAAELRAMLDERRDGHAHAPPRSVVPLPGGGTLLLMPAASATLTSVKLVTVHGENAAHGLPSVQAEVLVLDTASGRRLMLLEGATVTARRTAAVSLLAAQILAPQPAGPLLIVGAGTQGRSHLEAFAEGLGVREVYIASRTREHADTLASHARAMGLTAMAIDDPAEAIDRATLIVTGTTSTQPVLPANVRDDAFIAAVGAFRPDMAEVPPALVHRSRVYVDTLEGARDEAGDLLEANVDWSTVTEMAADLGRPEHGPVLFKSVGHALWDLAAARVAGRLMHDSQER